MGNPIMIPPNIQELFNQKESIEKEITEVDQILQKNNIGLNEPLVDREGFPRADIDIPSVRSARIKIIRLQNDLKQVMKDIEQALYDFHSSKKQNSESSKKPFAQVNMIQVDSPAYQAGLKQGDQIIQFNDIDVGHEEPLKKLAELVQNSENKTVSLQILRKDQLIQLELTPTHDWDQDPELPKSLIGCRIQPL